MNKKPDDIKSLEERIKGLKAKETQADKNAERSSFSYAAKTGFRVGTELLSGVLVGAALGYVLDNSLNTKPIFLILMLMLGGVAGFLNVYKFVKSEEKRNFSDKQE